MNEFSFLYKRYLFGVRPTFIFWNTCIYFGTDVTANHITRENKKLVLPYKNMKQVMP